MSSATRTPAAGRPLDVFKTWVVIRLMVSVRQGVRELGQAQQRDLFLLGGGDPQFLRRIVIQTLTKQGQHLAGALAGGADDKDPAEFLPVAAVAVGEGPVRGVRSVRRARLLAGGPCRGRRVRAGP